MLRTKTSLGKCPVSYNTVRIYRVQRKREGFLGGFWCTITSFDSKLDAMRWIKREVSVTNEEVI